ncbi:MAG: integrase domain-containing protein [Burkholderiales bacterium]|nr:integrase domain-containing protein [Burkholderiales bacterium]MCA3176031.1 integrase domain-containing protein [Burkholderiales bacterium]
MRSLGRDRSDRYKQDSQTARVDIGELLDQTHLPERLSQEIANAARRRAGQIISRVRKTNSPASTRTQEKRLYTVVAAFRTLDELKRCPQTVVNVREAHIEALVKYWREQKQFTLPTIKVYLSHLKWFLAVHHKEQIIKTELNGYFNTEEVANHSTIAWADKSWTGAGVDTDQVISSIRAEDARVAAVLLFSWATGARIAEASAVNVLDAIEQWRRDLQIRLDRCTKNGLARSVTPDDVRFGVWMHHAIPLINRRTGSVIPDQYSLEGWLKHTYYILHKHGIKKEGEGALGVTAHGLRHEFLQKIIEEVTGLPAPVKFWVAGESPVGQYDPELYQLARQTIVLAAGHFDARKANAYAGSATAKAARIKQRLERLQGQLWMTHGSE